MPETQPQKWTPEQLRVEWFYQFNERVGIMADGRTATDRQVQEAKIYADQVIEKLRRG